MDQRAIEHERWDCNLLLTGRPRTVTRGFTEKMTEKTGSKDQETKRKGIVEAARSIAHELRYLDEPALISTLNACRFCVFIKSSERRVVAVNARYNDFFCNGRRAVGSDSCVFLTEELEAVSRTSDELLMSGVSFLEMEHLAKMQNGITAKLKTVKLNLLSSCSMKPGSGFAILGVTEVIQCSGNATASRLERLCRASREYLAMKEPQQHLIRLMLQSHGTKEIAEILGITTKTVENRKKKIFERLRVTNLVELTKLFCRLQDGGCVNLGDD